MPQAGPAGCPLAPEAGDHACDFIAVVHSAIAIRARFAILHRFLRGIITMPELGFMQWLTVALCALMVGVTKSGVPGLGILVVPLMATVMPARLSTGVLLPMLLVGDVFAVYYYHRHAVWRHVVMLMPWALAGIVIGYFAMGHVSDRSLRPIIGGVILALLVLNQLRLMRDGDAAVPSHWAFGALIGLLAGITTMMANAAGPIMVIYLLAMRLPKTEFIGTGAWYFLVLNAVKVPFSMHLGLITSATLKFNLVFAPLIVAGAFAGLWVARRLPEKTFHRIVVVLTALAALNLLLGALR